jgi:DNA-binding GntR family transcriptional regulator
MLEMGSQFHQLLRNLCGKNVVVVILKQILLALEPYERLVFMRIERCDEIIAEHSEVLVLLKGKSGKAVEFAARRHIAEARKFYRACLEEMIPADEITQTSTPS